MVTDLTITFNTEVSIIAGAFQLIHRGTGRACSPTIRLR